VAVLSMLSGCALSVWAGEGLPADVRAALKEAGAFQARGAVGAIPVAVRAAFAKAAGGESFEMAEPGAPWQVSCVIATPPGKTPLPARRLVKVFLSKSFCILFYERGGVARTNHVAIFRLTQGDATLAWRAYVPQSAGDPAGLLTAVEKGQIHPPYDL